MTLNWTEDEASCGCGVQITGNDRAAMDAPKPPSPECPRHLCDACCEDRCCLGCHQEERADDRVLCLSCTYEQADATAEREAEAREALRERIWAEALHQPLELSRNLTRKP